MRRESFDTVGIEALPCNRPIGVYKRSPSAFVVCEMMDGAILPFSFQSDVRDLPGDSQSRFATLIMSKVNMEMHDALVIVAGHLGCPVANISYYGKKDRFAMTSQLIGIPANYVPLLKIFSHPGIFLRSYGETDDGFLRGKHEGNFFSIHVETETRFFDTSRIEKIPNFFGPQRFGGSRKEHLIGQCLVEGRFEEASDLVTYPSEHQEMTEVLKRTHSIKMAFLHPRMKEYTRFHVQQWQSYLFNKKLSLLMKAGVFPDLLVLVSPKSRNMYFDLWDPLFVDDDLLSLGGFLIRKSFIKPKNFSYKKTAKGFALKFALPPGSFATILLGWLFDLYQY